MTTYEALPNLTSVSSTVLTLLGTLFTVWMASKIFHAYAKKDYGSLVVELLAGVVVAFFVLLPDQGVALLQQLATMIFGAPAA